MDGTGLRSRVSTAADAKPKEARLAYSIGEQRPGWPSDSEQRRTLDQDRNTAVPHVLRRRLREWLAIAGVCLALSLAYSFAAKLRIAMRGEPVAWGAIPIEQAIHFGAWVALYPFVAFMAARFPLGERSLRHLPVHVMGALLFSPVLMMLTTASQAAVQGRPGLSWDTLVTRVIVPEYAWGMTAYIVLLSAAHALEFRSRSQQRAVQAARLEAALALARLQVLRMQLEPHFLFNALNSVSSLVHKDPDGAQRMLARLGDFLRLTLDDAMPQKVELRQELEFLERYLDIERVRFRDRLTVAIEAPQHLLDARVPYLILQPLVENAVRHGVAKHAGPGHVVVRASAEGTSLHLDIEDNGSKTKGTSTPNKPGIGLSNIRARLQQLYGPAASLNIDPSDGTHGHRVSVVLPLERSASEEPQLPEAP
jgi:two-component system, LytTR family, sensor kinase